MSETSIRNVATRCACCSPGSSFENPWLKTAISWNPRNAVTPGIIIRASSTRWVTLWVRITRRAVVPRRQPRIPLAELCSLPSFYLPVVSWKGDRVAFYWDKTGRIELYVLDLTDKAVHQISHGEVPRALRTGFTWSRDDRFIAFGKDAAGDAQDDL